MSSQAGKDVIYIDIDDEITAIIDKVRGSGDRIVALVLPKRATVLQSVVNMKLLKRTADEAKKHLVLITSEAGLMPLAGNVGLYVAKTLQSKPEIPHIAGHAVPDETDEVEEAVDMAAATNAAANLDPSRPVGAYAAGATTGMSHMVDDDDQPIELDNDDTSSAGDDQTSASAKSSKKPKGDKKFKIPNFSKFRLWLVLGGAGVVLLIVLWWVGFVVLPKASIDVKTNSTAAEANIDVTLNTSANSVDVSGNVIPAISQQTQKSLSQQVPTTGQQDNGTKASGSVTMTAQECGSVINASDVPAGSGLTANGVTFITQQNTSFTVKSVKNGCINFVANAATPVTAQNNGTSGNVGASSFSVAGRPDVGASSSAAMTGGTSNIVKIVSQADIDSAKQKIAQQDPASAKQELQQKLMSQNLYVVDASFATNAGAVTTSANVGDQADSLTVTQVTTYTMLGAHQDDLKKVIANAIKDKIDPSKQSIIDYGLTGATFKQEGQQGSAMTLSMNATAVAGTDLNLDTVKKQVAGKKSGDAKQIIQGYPGITSVNVSYSPFWVSSIPSNTSKITITVEKPTVKK